MTSSPDLDAVPSAWSARLASLIVSSRWLFLFLSMGLLLALYPASTRLSLDQSLIALYAPEDPHLKDYLISKSQYGGDEFVMVAWKQSELLERETLKQLKQVAQRLSALEGVQPASTQVLSEVLAPPKMSFLVRLFLRVPTTRERLLNFSEGILIGADRETTAIVLRLAPVENSPPRTEVFQSIQSMAERLVDAPAVVGEPYQVQQMFDYVEKDGATLGTASLCLLLLILGLLFRSLRWVLISLFVIQMSLIGVKGSLVLCDLKLSMVSSMLQSLMTIISIATVTHLALSIVKFQQRGMEPLKALEQALAELIGPIFWTLMTTMIGFAALLVSEITPVQSFGLMMAIGCFWVLVSVIGIVPALACLGEKPIAFKADPQISMLGRCLSALVRQLQRFPRLIGLFALLISLGFAAGIPKLQIETDFSKNFRESSSLVQALNFVEHSLGGAGTYEVSFDIPDELDDETLDQIRVLAEQLRQLKYENGESVLTKVVAMTDGLDFIPSLVASSFEKKQQLMQDFQPEFIPSLWNPEHQRMRIVLRALERQPAEQKLQGIQLVEELSAQHFENARCSGLYVLLAHLIESLLGDQLNSLLLAGAGIMLLISIAFRNLSYGLISLIPNLFPLMILMGEMGWMGTPVNIGTAMIASVSLGLTVDSTVHYLTRYQRRRQLGSTRWDAIQDSHQNVGRALIFANVALVCGFLVLTLSEFVPLIYFGVLVSVALLGGLIGNLVLLPLLIILVERETPKNTKR